MQMLKHAVIRYNLYAISLYAYLIYVQNKFNAKCILKWKVFLICAWNAMLIFFFFFCAIEHKKMLLVFYYNTCHFCFLSTTPVPFISITKRRKITKSFIFMTMFEDVSPHRKTQPSRLTIGQLEIPKKVRVNFSNWFQNNIVFIIQSNTFQKP